MALTVPGTCRYSVNGVSDGRAVVNVLDMIIDTTGSVGSREDAIDSQCGIIINEWCDHILPFLSSTYTFNNVSWVDLDSATGSVGSRASTSQETLPQPGGDGGAPLSVNAAMLVRKVTTVRRGARQGRMFLSPTTEVNTSGNVLTPGLISGLNTNLASFLGNVNQEDADPTEYQSQLAVVHVLTRDADGNPLTGESTAVSALVVQSRLASQRRRLRG